jgi:TRAP-type mannitol/chloroaromatic compound transport system substrate-binding protein
MDRRHFMARATVGATAATLAASSVQAQASGTVTWQLASSFPKTLDTIFGGATRVAERVAQLTEGRFQIKVAAAGEMMAPFAVFDATSKGEIQVAHTASYYFLEKNTALAFDSALPFGMQQRQHNAWYFHGGGQQLVRELLRGYNLIGFAGGATGTQMGGWYRKAINQLDDLKGLKMRIPGLSGRIIGRLGVESVALPGGEIVKALTDGRIDAAEWVGPYDDERLGLHKATSYYYYPGWWEPNVTLSFLVNLAAWNALPAPFKVAFETACNEAHLLMMAQYDQRNPDAMNRLLRQGVVFLPFPLAVMLAARDAAQAVYAEEEAKNPAFAKIYASWRDSLDDQNLWFKLAEGTYSTFVQSQRARRDSGTGKAAAKAGKK